MGRAAVNFQLLHHRVAERPFRQHSLDRNLQHALRALGVQLGEIDLMQLAGPPAVTVIDLALGLAAFTTTM